MKRHWIVFAAAVMALGITACGSGDGIVINGTTAGGSQEETSGQLSQETKAGTMIEIVTDETSPAPETAAQSAEGYSQETDAEPAGQPETAAVPQTAASTQAAASQTTASAQTSVSQTTAAQTAGAARPAETTAARTYKVTDVKKTMYATASVRVRSSYSTSSSVLAGLSEGEKVEVTGESENGWLRVNYKGNVGYVSKSYLTEQAPESAAQAASNGQSSGGSTGTGGGGNTSAGGNGGAGQTSQSGTGTGAGAGTGAGNTPSGGKTGPGGSSSGTDSSDSPAGQGGSGGSAGQSGSQSGPSVSESSASAGNSSSGTGSNSVTGSVTALDPSGVTIQTSNGATYQFVWGSDVPALAPGEKIQIFYETTSTGERRVVSYSK